MSAAVAQQPAVLTMWLGKRSPGRMRSRCVFVCIIGSDGVAEEVQMLPTDDGGMFTTFEAIKAMRNQVETANGVPIEQQTYADELKRNWRGGRK